MNRSFSKIRHIQEANQRLEKRMLNETMEFDIQGQQSDDLTSIFQSEMSNLGYPNVKLGDYVDTNYPTCTPQTGNPKYDEVLEKVAKWASSQTNIDVLRNEVKNIIAKMKSIPNKPVAEQVASTTATGLSKLADDKPEIFAAIGAILLVILVVNIARLVSNSRRPHSYGPNNMPRDRKCSRMKIKSPEGSFRL